MSGFTKLVPEIIQSSIWNESSDIRIVWITMLAMKDKNGYVRGDASTLSRFANVPPEIVRVALAKFLEPDPQSHTPDNEGRRIAITSGGWIVLNHERYRVRDRTEYMREYMRDYRKSESVNNVNTNLALPSVSVSVSDRGSEGGGFDAFWAAYPRKVGKLAARRAWDKAKTRPKTAKILGALAVQKAGPDWRKDNGRYIPHPATWLNQGRWDDEAVGADEIWMHRDTGQRYQNGIPPESERAQYYRMGGK